MAINATIEPNLIPVIPSEPDGQKRLTIDIPNGWDDCKQLCKRVLSYAGKYYKFIGWNSDTNQCYFIQTTDVARLGPRIR